MLLSKLIKDIEIVSVCGDISDMEITEVVSDSRKVVPGSLFVCLKGIKKDGNDYISEAERRGAAAIISGVCSNITKNAVLLCVNDPHSAYAAVSAAAVGNPDRSMKVIGVTGTNGKTTTVNMITAALTGAGRRCAVIGTLGAAFEGEQTPLGTMTTPDPETLYPLLKKYKEAGAEYVVMEVSSHALELRKADGIRFYIGAITNITPEHLDFHKNMENYKKAKSRLFSLSEKGVFLTDDEFTTDLYEKAECKKIRCSVKNKDADYTALDIELKGTDGVQFGVKTDREIIRIKSFVAGEFTVSNALLAAAVLKECGLTPEEISRGIAGIKGIKGRMEKLPLEAEYSVFIDFAHTPDALSKLLETVRKFKRPEERIITLFGCGGDRDPSKRSLMGAIASRMSDFVIITEDNSRSEKPAAIIDQILSGFDKKCPYKRIDDRRKAINYVIANADKNDIILLCGKGHEEYEIDKDGKHPFSEREIVMNAYKERKAREAEMFEKRRRNN